jgi:hypothetical protein
MSAQIKKESCLVRSEGHFVRQSACHLSFDPDRQLSLSGFVAASISHRWRGPFAPFDAFDKFFFLILFCWLVLFLFLVKIYENWDGSG